MPDKKDSTRDSTLEGEEKFKQMMRGLKKKIIIETDGRDYTIIHSDVTVLELKEICREILEELRNPRLKR